MTLQINQKNIRRAQSSDFLEIAALDRESWGSDPKDAFIPDGEHAWRLWVEFAHVLVAEADNQIVGAILAFPTIEKKEILFAVHKVFVHPQYKGNGLGTRLFYQLLEILDKEEQAASFLTVQPQNKPAIKLYNNMGYESAKYVEGYYRPNEHRVVMVRQPL